MSRVPSVFLTISCFLLGCLNVVAADNRTDELTQQRMSKLKTLTPQKQGMFEKFLFKIEDQFREDALKGNFGQGWRFSPRFGMIVTGSGLATGFRVSTSYFQASAAYSLSAYQEYDTQIGLNAPVEGVILKGYYPRDVFRFRGEKPGPFLYLDARYRNFPQEDFYGIGSESRLEDRSDFLFEEVSYHAVGGYQFGRRLRVDFRAGQLFQNISSGTDTLFPNTEDVFSPTEAPGLIHEPDFLSFGSSFLLDYRDKPKNPHSGGAVGVLFLRFDDRNDDVYEFNRWTFDARHFLPLGSNSRVLAMRFWTSFTDVADDRQVPFYMMETLGGSYTLRGFPKFRFQDNDLAYFSAEYRVEAATWLEIAPFFDAGKVFTEFSELDFNGWEKTYGIGVRFKTSNGVLFRVDTGKSREAVEILFKLGAAF